MALDILLAHMHTSTQTSPARATSPQPHVLTHILQWTVGEVRGKQGGGTERHPDSTGFTAVRTEKEGPKIYISNKILFFFGENSNKYKDETVMFRGCWLRMKIS